MKRVRLITTDKHNGKEAISRTPLRNRYFFEGAWQEINVAVKPEILRDAQIIETIEAIFAELGNNFDIRVLIDHVECETPNRVHEATIQRQLCQLRQYGKLDYEVIDEKKGTYRKLPVASKTCAEQVKIEFQPDWKKRFVEFLKDEGAYERYINCISDPYIKFSGDHFTNIDEMIKDIKTPCYYISSAFNWIREDIKFWNTLNHKWEGNL